MRSDSIHSNAIPADDNQSHFGVVAISPRSSHTDDGVHYRELRFEKSIYVHSSQTSGKLRTGDCFVPRNLGSRNLRLRKHSNPEFWQIRLQSLKNRTSWAACSTFHEELLQRLLSISLKYVMLLFRLCSGVSPAS